METYLLLPSLPNLSPSALSPISPGPRVSPWGPWYQGLLLVHRPLLPSRVSGLDAHLGPSGKRLAALPCPPVQSIGGTLARHGLSSLTPPSPVPISSHTDTHLVQSLCKILSQTVRNITGKVGQWSGETAGEVGQWPGETAGEVGQWSGGTAGEEGQWS